MWAAQAGLSVLAVSVARFGFSCLVFAVICFGLAPLGVLVGAGVSVRFLGFEVL